jgi:peptidylprolyl isomerase
LVSLQMSVSNFILKGKKMTKTVTQGSTVTLHYTGTLEDGTEFDSSRGRTEPMTVAIGNGQLIQGFETALTGMTEGETKTFTIAHNEAYGPHNPEQVTTLQKSVFPGDFEFTAGMTVPLTNQDSETFMVVLTEINENDVTADFNHPLSGKDLTFEVEVITVSDEETSS